MQETARDEPLSGVRIGALQTLEYIRSEWIAHLNLSRFEHGLIWLLSFVLLGLWFRYELPSSILLIVTGLQLLFATGPRGRE